MKLARYRVHRLIQDLMADEAASAEFRRDPEAIFARYAFSEAEAAALRSGTPEALIGIGVHPNLQMKWRRIAGPSPAPGPGPLSEYMERLVGRMRE
ncbi:MAG: hypothetical protein ACRED8_00460 [Caulobacteraceae bacterium]